MPPAPPGAILHYVGYDVDRGGILAVIRALAAENRFPCVLGVNPSFIATRSREIPLRPLPPIDGDTINAATAWRAFRVAQAVRIWMREDPRRVFHGHSRAGLLVALWLRWMGEERVISTVHCYGRQRWFYRWAARRMAGQLFWLSPAMKAYYGVRPSDWSDCLPPCIRLPDAIQGRPRSSGGVRFGCVGALVPVKQWELALAALARVPRDVPLRLVHAGADDGSAESRAYAARIRSMAATPEVAARVEFRGEVTDMGAFYRDIDCLLIPSRWEAFSVAALEAGAHGVPLLAADAAGNRDLVAAARLGWVFTPDSADACAEKMVTLARGPELRAWRPDPAALARFNAATSAAQHAAVYQRLI
jgi:glycosyltransferase involved in cell wall biosynthesis